ncbi:SRPBCC family protein [Glycomyces salinus]|uniref:SRPBCC family protein n=1 Tax=Glycomyces salinus TaxID=980294 RepID=UPI0018EBB8E2|nr:SRPBCC domain-containing protein [Glycomyces salinus]
MVDILHRVGITEPQAAVYRALTDIDGLSGWWTRDTTGDGAPGGVIKFRFEGAPEPGGFDMRVLEATPDERVRWEVIDGPEEWIGTTIEWDLSTDGEYTIVMFAHRGWREPVEFMHHCSTKWALFLMSLKQLLESGKGAPAPNDVKIDNFN